MFHAMQHFKTFSTIQANEGLFTTAGIFDVTADLQYKLILYRTGKMLIAKRDTFFVILTHLLHETHKMSLHTRASSVRLLNNFEKVYRLAL
jgi:hypothetical protein